MSEPRFWLISYRMRFAFKYTDRLRHNEPMDTLDAIDIHPGDFVLERRKEYNALESAIAQVDAAPLRAAQIERVYSAIEISEAQYKEFVGLI